MLGPKALGPGWSGATCTPKKLPRPMTSLLPGQGGGSSLPCSQTAIPTTPENSISRPCGVDSGPAPSRRDAWKCCLGSPCLLTSREAGQEAGEDERGRGRVRRPFPQGPSMGSLPFPRPPPPPASSAPAQQLGNWRPGGGGSGARSWGGLGNGVRGGVQGGGPFCS